MKNKKILVTGASGYIGSTFTYEALKKGFCVVGIDNFSNSSPLIISKLLDKFPKYFDFYEVDLRDKSQILNLFLKEQNLECIVHFAALKSVPDSQINAQLYQKNNVQGTRNLLAASEKVKIKKIVFSSTAAVYGEHKTQPVCENFLPKPESYYAQTKLECEEIIKKHSKQKGIGALSLRYFNPVASHRDYFIHEDYKNSSNLMSVIIKAATNKIDSLKIFGNDFDTRDGTGERDFIHISDLIDGHFFAIDKLTSFKSYDEINIGTGKGITVLEMIAAFKKYNNVEFNTEIVGRRDGDISRNFANTDKAARFLGWQSSYNLKDMCIDSWVSIQNEIK